MARGKGREQKRRKQAGAHTRACVRYQDDCVAYAVLMHLIADDLDGIEVEREPDLIIHRRCERRMLVSIKHREPHQRGEVGWTWAELDKQSVLQRLYEAWDEADRDCAVTFYSSAGFAGEANDLRDVGGAVAASDALIDELSSRLKEDRADVREFLAALELPEDPLPRRAEIRDVVLERVREFLAVSGRSDAHAAECYDALLNCIELASRDRANARGPRATVAGTPTSEDKRYLGAQELAELLLRVHDHLAVPGVATTAVWEPDPLFVGREPELAKLGELLIPGVPQPVAPVVLCGMSGIGKTALAQQFAATHRSALTPIFIDASSRVALAAGLRALGEGTVEAVPRALPGPVAPVLPGSSAMLLILDGVPSRDVVQGLIPRRGLCRVLITTIVARLDDGFSQIPIAGWEPTASQSYVRARWREISEEEAVELTSALHHHPLAILQALDFCAGLELTVGEYLRQLRASPLVTLSSGAASGHPDTVLRAIQLHLAAAEQNDPAALDLLAMITFLAPGDPDCGVPERLFENRSPIVVKLSGTDTLTVAEAMEATPEADALSQLLADSARRRRAALVLTELSLAAMRNGELSVHPLTSMVLRAQLDDITPWMEVGLGLFSGYIQPQENGPLPDPQSEIPIMARLADLCLEHDVRGPGLYAALLELTPHVANLLDVGKAVTYGRLAYAWAQRTANSDPTGLTLARARSHLAEVLMLDGELGEPLDLYRTNLNAAITSGDTRVLTQRLRELASMAVEARSDDLIDQCQQQLSSLLEGDDWQSPSDRVVALLARARLVSHRGDIEAAEADVCSVLEASGRDELSPSVRLEMHQMAAVLSGRGRSEQVSDMHYERILEELRDDSEHPRSRAYIHALIDAADANISADALDRAAARLDEANGLLRRWFGDDALLETEFLAASGRLELHCAFAEPTRLALARTKLVRAVDRYGRQSGVQQRGMAAALINLSQALALGGDLDGAVRRAVEAHARDLNRYGPGHPEVVLDKAIVESHRATKRLLADQQPRLSRIVERVRVGDQPNMASRVGTRNVEERTGFELADELERGLAERALPRDHPDAGPLARSKDLMPLPKELKVHPFVLAGEPGVLADFNLDDRHAATTALDALTAAGLPRVRDLNSYLPAPPKGWNFLLWPHQVLIATGRHPLRKLLFEQLALDAAWWHAYNGGWDAIALLVGNVRIGEGDVTAELLLERMGEGDVAGCGLLGMRV